MNLQSIGRIALAVSIGVGFASTASADGGIKFGPTFAKFSSDALDFKNRTGIHAGVFFGGNRSGVFGLQGELNWIRRRAETELAQQAIRIDYLQVPVLLRLNIGTNSASGFAVYGIAGPAFDIKIATISKASRLTTGGKAPTWTSYSVAASRPPASSSKGATQKDYAASTRTSWTSPKSRSRRSRFSSGYDSTSRQLSSVWPRMSRLVHPAWHGAWCWERLVPLLREAGHEVFTPTLTGLGDRSHLVRPDTGLETHVKDVIQGSDLRIFLGHCSRRPQLQRSCYHLRRRCRAGPNLECRLSGRVCPGTRPERLRFIACRQTPSTRKSGQDGGWRLASSTFRAAGVGNNRARHVGRAIPTTCVGCRSVWVRLPFDTSLMESADQILWPRNSSVPTSDARSSRTRASTSMRRWRGPHLTGATASCQLRITRL